nr:hypothetical protein [Clostridia bacterium]
MKSAGTTAPQCCELSFNYFTVLLTGCSSKQPGFTIVGFKPANDCAYRQKKSASLVKNEEALGVSIPLLFYSLSAAIR